MPASGTENVRSQKSQTNTWIHLRFQGVLKDHQGDRTFEVLCNPSDLELVFIVTFITLL